MRKGKKVLIEVSRYEEMKSVLDRLIQVWIENPNLRLGQLIENVFPNTQYDYTSAYWEEDKEYIAKIEQFYASKPTFRNTGTSRRDKKEE